MALPVNTRCHSSLFFSSCIFSFPGAILDRLHMSDANSKPQLLIVDDEAEVRGVLRDLLGDTYDCGEATSAEEALTQLRARDYQLVISDITMSGMSGLEMIPCVNVRPPGTTCVVL